MLRVIEGEKTIGLLGGGSFGDTGLRIEKSWIHWVEVGMRIGTKEVRVCGFV